MCFDTQSSLLAWSLTYSIGAYLYFRNTGYDRWNAAFIMTFATIQLLEAGLWVTLDSKDPKVELNEVLTKLVLLTLLSQPLVQTYMGYKYTPDSREFLGLLSWIFFGILIWGLFRISKNGFSTIAGPNGHLIWTDKNSPVFLGGWWVGVLYLIGLFIPLLFMKDGKGWVLMIIGITTALLSLIMASKGEFSSYWCYTTVIYAVATLF